MSDSSRYKYDILTAHLLRSSSSDQCMREREERKTENVGLFEKCEFGTKISIRPSFRYIIQ